MGKIMDYYLFYDLTTKTKLFYHKENLLKCLYYIFTCVNYQRNTEGFLLKRYIHNYNKYGWANISTILKLSLSK